MSKLENSGDVGWAIFPISFNFCSSPDTGQRPCGKETGVTISGTLVIADTALCKVSSTFLQLVDAAPAQFVWCDVGAGCWLPPGLLLSVFIQWVLTLTRILNILPWPSHNISHNMPPPHTLPCRGSLARLGRKFQFAILKLFPEVSNHQSIPERSLIKQECYLHKMQCRGEAADTELVCRRR